MDILTVRNLDPDVKAKLRRRAARNGRSMEAEARAVLAEGVERDEVPIDIAASAARCFAGLDVDLHLPDRSAQQQREIDLFA